MAITLVVVFVCGDVAARDGTWVSGVSWMSRVLSRVLSRMLSRMSRERRGRQLLVMRRTRGDTKTRRSRMRARMRTRIRSPDRSPGRAHEVLNLAELVLDELHCVVVVVVIRYPLGSWLARTSFRVHVPPIPGGDFLRCRP